MSDTFERLRAEIESLELGWSPEEWATWTTETLVRDLVEP